MPAPVVTLGGQDITPQCTFSVQDNNNTALDILLSDSDCQVIGQFDPETFYASASLSFDPGGHRGAGHRLPVHSTCTMTPQARGGVALDRPV